MNTLKNILTCLTLLSFTTLFSQANTATEPNIIFFIVDDLGYYDIDAYNNLLTNGPDLYETPNIDALASEGILFTHGYEAAPRCAASRTSIMSGKFESRPSVSAGMYLPADNNANGYSETTFAQALKDNGYKTFFIGKWHLGHDTSHYPDSFGFDINIAGSDFGAPPTYWYPYSAGGDTLLHLNTGGTSGEYLTDRITDETNSFIDDQTTNNPTQPFLAMVSHYGVHTPLEAKTADITYFQNKIDNTTYTMNEFENDLTAKTKLRQDNATYAAMIKSIDESLGAIRQNLIDEGIADNTIIIVTSDNGGLSTTKINGNRPLSTSNRPFRGGKTWLYEGGIRLPLIVYGPDYRTGVIEDEPVIGTDFSPTLLEMGNTPLLPNQHLDGESFEDLLLTAANGGDANYSRINPLIWDFNFASSGTANVSMAAVRQGNYKLLEFKYNNVFELYDVVNDPSESTDLSVSQPVILEQLKTALFSYRSDAVINHRVHNTGHQAENKNLYDNMNTVTGTNIQANYGCAEPSGGSNAIIYNSGYECWYDLDWPISVNAASEATLEQAALADVRTGDVALKVNVVNGGGYGKVSTNNTSFIENLQGGDITLNVFAKSNSNNRIRFQLKVFYTDGTNNTFNAATFTTSSTYQQYSHTYLTATITNKATESIEVRLQLGKDNGEIFLDDWTSAVAGIVLSTPLVNKEEIAIYPNPTSDYIYIDGPLVATKAYIMDVSGKIVKKSIGDVERINIQDLPKGMYLMKVFVEGNQYLTKKIIKN